MFPPVLWLYIPSLIMRKRINFSSKNVIMSRYILRTQIFDLQQVLCFKVNVIASNSPVNCARIGCGLICLFQFQVIVSNMWHYLTPSSWVGGQTISLRMLHADWFLAR